MSEKNETVTAPVEPSPSAPPAVVPDTPAVPDQENKEDSPETQIVSHKSYKKAVDGKKKAEAKLAEIEAERKKAEEQALKDKEEWKTLYEKSNAEIEAEKAAREKKEEELKKARGMIALQNIAGFNQDIFAGVTADDLYNVATKIYPLAFDDNGNVVDFDVEKAKAALEKSGLGFIKKDQPPITPGGGAPVGGQGEPKTDSRDREKDPEYQRKLKGY